MSVTPELAGRTPGKGAAAAGPFSAGCAWVGGRLVPIADAAVPILDAGFVRSDLTHDVVAVWEGQLFRLDVHLERFRQGMAKLHLDCGLSIEEIRTILLEVIKRSGLRDAYVQMIATRGVPPAGERDPRRFENRFYALAIPYMWIVKPEAQTAGVDLVVAHDTRRIPPESLDPTVKNFHWGDLVRGLFEAYDRDATQVVLPDADGNVTEGPGTNLFAVLGGALHTPARGVLEGITRRTVLELAAEDGIETQVTDLPARSLAAAEEIFLTSTAGGVMPVATLDGAQVGTGCPGPITRRLRDRYWEIHGDPRYSTPVSYDD